MSTPQHVALQWVFRDKMIAIVRGLSKEWIAGLARALHAGGISMMEITFNQKDPDSWKDTAEAIRWVADEFAGKMLPGAGTVLSVAQLKLAHSAGAQYIVSPDTNPLVIEKTKSLGMASFPGAMTPTEIALAHRCGADAVKVFPAGVLGASYIRAVRAPLSQIPLLAVGGIDAQNAKEYLRAGAAGLGVGGSLVSAKWIQEGRLDQIEALARACCDAVRGEG